jgi:hypothetical protein
MLHLGYLGLKKSRERAIFANDDTSHPIVHKYIAEELFALSTVMTNKSLLGYTT